NGNRGQTSAQVTFTGQTITADITFLAQGAVTGVVTDAANNPVPNATVLLNSASIFGGNFTTATNGSGHYSIPKVFLGSFNINASDALTHLGGHGSGNIASDNQMVTVNVVLTAAGSITGTVFHFGGASPVPSAQVTLSNGQTTNADSAGKYTFNDIPVGSYTTNATELSTGDR